MPGIWVVLLVLGLPGRLMAQTNAWDSVLANSQWYVPPANLSAYMTPGTNLALPQLIGDQTIWQINGCVDGVFTGTSNATFKIGPVESFSNTTMNGLVIGASGQMRIVFSDGTNPPTIGIGQMREVNNATYVEMQMISGSADEVFVTHWAYMASGDGSSPELGIDLLSPEWSWMAGTSWNLECADLFGPGQTGTFQVSSYVNGYFWGTGSGPVGSEAASFSLIGSATPEGNVLFNILSGDTLTSLTGQISGDAANGAMGLRAYEAGEIGGVAMAQVVPEPGTVLLLVLGSVMVWQVVRRG